MEDFASRAMRAYYYRGGLLCRPIGSSTGNVHAFPHPCISILCSLYSLLVLPHLRASKAPDVPSITMSRPFLSVPSVSATPPPFLRIWSSVGRSVFFETALPHLRFSKAQEWRSHLFVSAALQSFLGGNHLTHFISGNLNHLIISGFNLFIVF